MSFKFHHFMNSFLLQFSLTGLSVKLSVGINNKNQDYVT